MMCAGCGQPVSVAPSNVLGEQAYHGECYRLAFPPEHPDEWPKPIGLYSHDERVADGLEKP